MFLSKYHFKPAKTQADLLKTPFKKKLGLTKFIPTRKILKVWADNWNCRNKYAK